MLERILSALSLLVLGIHAHDSAYDFALAIAAKHQAAVFTDRCTGWTDFHGVGVAGAGVEGVAEGVTLLLPYDWD